jgi:hypothetical protein
MISARSLAFLEGNLTCLLYKSSTLLPNRAPHRYKLCVQVTVLECSIGALTMM